VAGPAIELRLVAPDFYYHAYGVLSGASTMYLIAAWQMPIVRRPERHFVRGRLQGSEYGRA
jgi:hypothetical protein